MNVDLKQTFARIKPVCDIVMMCPNAESIAQFRSRVSELKKEAIQELQQYLLFPFITHIKSTEIEKKHELQWRIIDGMKFVLEKVTVVNFEMCMMIETGLLSLIFDNSKPGMIAQVPEELLHNVMKCLTVLMLNIDDRVRKKLLRSQVPLIAQAVFVSVHIAKLHKLRALRLAAIYCVTAHTASHPRLTSEAGHIEDIPLEALVVDVLASILPGVLAALQDVATAKDNPGHAVVVAAINAIHRILCLTMHDKFLLKHPAVSAEDFAKMVRDKKTNKEVSNKEKKPKELSKRSAEWYSMAGEKLTLISKCLSVLTTHEHARVRRELAVYCARLLNECHETMKPSVPTALEILITLSKDEYSEVSEYSAATVRTYFAGAAGEARHHAMDSLCQNFFSTLTKLPRILNNIDSSRKLAALDLLNGYIEVMCDEARPQRLTTALASDHNLQTLVTALTEAAAVQTDLTLLRRHAARDVSSGMAASPRGWRSVTWRRRARGGCGRAALLGAADCAALLLDRLPPHTPAQAALANAIASAPAAPPELARRVIAMYVEDNVWYLPLEVGGGDAPVTEADTFDVSVYDPRAWTKDSVPGLFEGATETRTTGISYETPRTSRRDPSLCATLGEAQRNMALVCILTEGVGLMAKRLGPDFQPYLLKTLCLVLERVGSTYEMLHLAGVKAISDIATACSHASVGELIRCNADYFTNQISVRLKKAWNTESALQILSVVMEYSDASILNCLYGIVEDVLVQSLDKYHERNLLAYLQVFLTFITCIRKWFPPRERDAPTETDEKEIDILKDLMAYVSTADEVDKLMSKDDEGKTAEEMFREDELRREEDVLDYDDRVTEETPPLPRHITVTQTILKRCVNFLSSKSMDEAIMALQILNQGLPVLAEYENELLPLVHLTWAPLVATFERAGPAVLRRAFELLVTMAALAKDFIRHRTVTEVLPNIYSFLLKSSRDSLLKDQGSAYRSSAAFRLQLAALASLATLIPDLGVDGDQLDHALKAVEGYLSKKQPKPLQELSVKFFKAMLRYDYGATWAHLRQLAANECVLHPPEIRAIDLVPIVGTPYEPTDKNYEANIQLVFDGIDQQGSLSRAYAAMMI
ncbi:LOW QUALITY PROTEIN: telo2 interacting protein 1 [Choristoneura fumiferana]|uniref:LOW QUALITY PROTEIN: telo2 interacting protein 1 n=1 Tax=Choristoneura fumiferana TaxID=7141 RepID=UPI003D159CA6